MNRRLISIAFLAIMCLPFVGMQGWLQLRKHAIRKHVKEALIAGLDMDDLVLLRFSKDEASELRWEHDKEFEFEGWMYDVVSIETTEDSIFYRCWWDNEETQLNRQLKELAAMAFGTDQQRQERQSHYDQIIRTLYFFSPDSWIFIATSVADDSSKHIVSFSHRNTSPSVPPPELS